MTIFVAINVKVITIAVGMYNIIANLLFTDSNLSGQAYSVIARTGAIIGKSKLNGV